MEQELGVRLLERSNRVTGLTPAGRVLMEEADRSLRQVERTIALTCRAGSGAIGTLRVGFVASAARYLFPSMIRDFRSTHPDVELSLTEASTSRQVSALLEDRQDVGVVALPLTSGAENHIKTRTLLRSRFVAALPTTPTLADEDQNLDLAVLAAEPWILFPAAEGPGLSAVILQACARAGFSPRVVQQASQMETIVDLVASGLGVSIVPEPLGRSGRLGVTFRPVLSAGKPVPYDVALAWNANNKSPTLHAFVASMTRGSPRRDASRSCA